MPLRGWRRWWRREPAFGTAEWAALLAGNPLLAGLDPAARERLRELTARFLERQTITPVQGLELDASERLALAAHASLPLLRFGAQGLRGWSQVIVHPGAFRVEYGRHGASLEMDALDVVHEGFDEREGESWEHGPMVLSWADLAAEMAEPEPGYQLVVHEMAHKLDALDGLMDGTPPLPRDWQRQWAIDFGAAFAAIQAALDTDPEAKTAIDAYAAESPEEFFAVTSEYHFTAPELLRAAFPAVAAHLERFYGPPPVLAVETGD